MAPTVFHALFAPMRRVLPGPLARGARAAAAALLAPIEFTRHTGHWRSSLLSKAVTGSGAPLPWYTYPCIDFLLPRRKLVRSVLEFGAGQSTLWWAAQGAEVVAFEADRGWYEYLRKRVPSNVDLRLVSMESPERCVSDVREQLRACGRERFDVVVIDGLYRTELVRLSPQLRAPSGVIVCDDSEGYDVQASLADSGLQRVDFFGFAPGVIVPRCTSVYWRDSALFAPTLPISSEG
jgi:predicted O-methyltransferase YrrM